MSEKRLISKKEAYYESRDTKKIMTAVSDLGSYYFKKEQYEKAVEEYKELALLYSKNSNDQINLAHTNRMLGECYMYLGKFNLALEALKIYYDISNSTKNYREKQRALVTIGRVYFSRAIINSDNVDNYFLEKASNFYTKSLKLIHKIPNVFESERNDMEVGSLINLGNVFLHMKDSKKAREHFQSALTICRSSTTDEELKIQTMEALAQFYSKEHYLFKDAICLYDDAIKLAGNDRKAKQCELLCRKFDVYVRMRDFLKAKNTLWKATKIRHPNDDEQRCIEHNLKLVQLILNIQQELLKTPDDNYVALKMHYERMADGLCELKQYGMAIEFYQKMLTCVEISGGDSKLLATAYVSLAMTYCDNKEYDEALQYFQKELALNENNSNEKIDTYLNIIKVLILKKSPECDLRPYYGDIFKELENATNVETHRKRIVKHLMRLLTGTSYDLLNDLKNKCPEIACESGESSDDLTEDINYDATVNTDEITLSQISGPDEFSDDEISGKKPRRATEKGNRLILKKNAKGETKLHTACIKGDIKEVKNLLKMNFPSNVMDNNGWYPIHEASNLGHTEIVEMLINHGSPIDCLSNDGISPLMDAAVNGHLDVIDILLKKGANTILKDKEGLTAFDRLKKSTCVDKKDPLYKKIYTRLQRDIRKANIDENTAVTPSTSAAYLDNTNKTMTVKSGFTTPVKLTTPQSPARTSARKRYLINSDSDDESPSFSIVRKSTSTSPRASLGIISDSNSDDDLPSLSVARPSHKLERNPTASSGSDFVSSGPDVRNLKTYLHTIESCRKKNAGNLQKPIKRFKTSQMPALIPEEEQVDDNWMITDTFSVQKRKRSVEKMSPDSTRMVDTTRTRKSSNGSVDSLLTSIVQFPTSTRKMLAHSPFKNDTDSDNDIIKLPSSNNIKRKVQRSLYDAGFSRLEATPPENENPYENLRTSPTVSQYPLSNLACPERVGVLSKYHNICVHVGSKIFVVPIPLNKADDLTIKWLVDQTAHRYYVKEGVKPSLQFETEDHAEFYDVDPLSCILSYKDIYSKILDQTIPSLTQCYRDACKHSKIDVDASIIQTLEQATKSFHLNLSDIYSSPLQLRTLMTALKLQENLEVLILDNCNLTDELMRQLSLILSSLINLHTLSLQLNNFTHVAIKYLSDALVKPMKLNSLDLSFNSLTDRCIEHVSRITSAIDLKQLDLSGCHLTNQMFDGHDFNLELKSVEHFKMCFNENLNAGIFNYHRFNIGTYLRGINLSTIEGACVSLISMFEYGEPLHLEDLVLNWCNVDDEELESVLQSLCNCNKLNRLSVAYNPKLTTFSLETLLKNAKFNYVDLLGCPRILENFKEDKMCHRSNMYTSNEDGSKIKFLRLNCANMTKVRLFSSFWSLTWGTQSIEYVGSGKCEFSIKDFVLEDYDPWQGKLSITNYTGQKN